MKKNKWLHYRIRKYISINNYTWKFTEKVHVFKESHIFQIFKNQITIATTNIQKHS